MTDDEIHVRETEEGRREVLDPVRRRWVALTPEEWVRQQTIMMLHNRCKYPLECMQVEGTIGLGSLTRRCDIVVYGSSGTPLMIVECKEPGVKITQKVCDQACRYNTALHVPCLLLTNGNKIIVLRVDFANGRLIQLDNIPSKEELEMLKNEQK